MNVKDIAAGLVFGLVGITYGSIAWQGLPIGQVLDMGPGFFPIVLSGCLVLLGLTIGVRGLRAGDGTSFGRVPWRAGIFLVLAVLAFAALGEEIGLFPSVLLLAFLAAMSDAGANWRRATLVSVCIAGFCTLVFSYGIGLPIPVIGPFWQF